MWLHNHRAVKLCVEVPLMWDIWTRSKKWLFAYCALTSYITCTYMCGRLVHSLDMQTQWAYLSLLCMYVYLYLPILHTDLPYYIYVWHSILGAQQMSILDFNAHNKLLWLCIVTVLLYMWVDRHSVLLDCTWPLLLISHITLQSIHVTLSMSHVTLTVLSRLCRAARDNLS